MLQIVFQNILMNAAQAMDGQGQIDVTIAGANGRCRIAVADRGPACPTRCARKRSTRSSRRSIAAPVSGCPSRSGSSKRTAATIHIDVPPGGGTTISVDLPLPA